MKIIAFAGSNSSVSINKKLITHISTYFSEATIEVLDLNDFEMPIYKSDREKNDGIPQLAHEFAKKIDSADLLLVSLAEHNGAYSTAFKNIFDWVSRIPNRKPFGEKNMFLTATSPGARGGMNVLEIAKNRFPFSGATVLETFSLPSFNDNFSIENGITLQEKKIELEEKIQKVKQLIN
jgi:chromate reductase, NAD(P)H dehydrogenase (quinone)